MVEVGWRKDLSTATVVGWLDLPPTVVGIAATGLLVQPFALASQNLLTIR